MTTFETRPGVVEVISKAVELDEGTAEFIVDALLYEALCEELDLQDDHLQADAARIMAHEAKQGLQVLAKRYATASDEEKIELSKRAEHLYQLVEIGKSLGGQDDDPNTPFHDARAKDGTFRAKVMDALKLFAGNQDSGIGAQANSSMTKLRDGNRYQKARVLGDALQKLPSGDAQAAGKLARAIGDIGPEAEKVFGRGLTRLAYRYRGTERRPSDELRTVIGAKLQRAQNKINEGVPPEQAKALPDKHRLHHIGSASAGYLLPMVPDQKLAELSLRAGQLPPSRGVIVDRDGNVTSEAMGFNGDHYLPFDLKNLKRLKGGQYVRTRTTGGLTDEDIYTGLLTGARQVQVISNSGVFTIEFDPSLRGGRRYSDKARQMVKRYAKLVATVDDAGLYAQDIEPATKAKFKQQAYEAFPKNEKLAKERYTELRDAERQRLTFAVKTDEQLLAEAHETVLSDPRYAGLSEPQLRTARRELMGKLKGEQKEKAVKKYRLDGEGYGAAMKALEQEFPFYIRTADFKPLDEWMDLTGLSDPKQKPRPRGGGDIGYTPRGEIEQSKFRRQQSSAGASTSTSTSTDAPAGAGAPKAAAGVAPNAAKMSFEQALKAPGNTLGRDLGDALDRSLQVREELDLMPHAETDTESFIAGQPIEQWSSWVLQKKSGPAGVAEWLLDPATDLKHLEKAELALDRLERAKGDGFPDMNGFDEARALLYQVRMVRQPFAPAAKDDVLAMPDHKRPLPQPLPEIEEIGADMGGLKSLAEEDPQTAQLVVDLLGTPDATIGRQVTEQVKALEALAKWPKGDNGKPDEYNPGSADPAEYDKAVAFHDDPQQMEEWQALKRTQRAWSIARAMRVVEALTGQKAADARPKVVTGKRAPRVPVIKVHRPGSPAARALAARGAR